MAAPYCWRFRAIALTLRAGLRYLLLRPFGLALRAQPLTPDRFGAPLRGLRTAGRFLPRVVRILCGYREGFSGFERPGAMSDTAFTWA
jgi:hypothetical protein